MHGRGGRTGKASGVATAPGGGQTDERSARLGECRLGEVNAPRKCRDYLHGLGRRVVVVVVRLVVLVPVVTSLHSVEVPGFARAVLVVPPVRLDNGKRKGSKRGIKKRGRVQEAAEEVSDKKSSPGNRQRQMTRTVFYEVRNFDSSFTDRTEQQDEGGVSEAQLTFPPMSTSSAKSMPSSCSLMPLFCSLASIP